MDTTPKQGPELRSLAIDMPRQGSHVLIEAVAGKRILVYGWDIEPEETTSLALLSHLTPITGQVRRVGGMSFARPVQAEPYCQTESGEALRLFRGAVPVRGQLWYRQQ